MLRLLSAFSLSLLLATTAACGGGEDKKKTAATPTPAPLPPGFVTESGRGWSFARPESWEKVKTDPPAAGEELAIYQSPPGTGELPTQVGIGTEADYEESLATATKVGRDINKARFPTYEIAKEGAFEIEGAEAFKIDANYKSFTDEKTPIRIIDLYVQTPDKKQMNLFIRGPEADFDRSGIEQAIDTLRIG